MAKLTVTLSAVLLLAVACSSDKRTSPDSDGDRDSGTPGSGDGKSGTNSSGGASGFGNAGSSSGSGGASSGTGDGGLFGDASASNPLELCGGACACADGIDNDGDGVTDGFDAECTGASDDDEGSFATGIPGDNVDPKWQDCFYDGNSGAGDDGCRYHTDCLTGELADDDPKCTVTQQCIDFCKPRTPNGCDCFGCCTFTLDDGSMKSVVLEAGCEEGTWEGCTECQPMAECGNTCGRCELCPGKEVEDLPADCGPPPPTAGSGGTGDSGGTGGSGGTGDSGGTGGSDEPPPPSYTCDGGEQVCTDTSDCPSLHYCSFGCCQPTVI